MTLQRDTPKSRAWAAKRSKLNPRGRRGRANAAAAPKATETTRCQFPHAEASRILTARAAAEGQRIRPVISCRGRLDPHHMHGRGSRPDLVQEHSNQVWLCRNSHDFITHTDPSLGRELGLVLRPWETDERITYRPSKTVLLTQLEDAS